MYSISQLLPGPNQSTCRQSDIAVRERERALFTATNKTLFLPFLPPFRLSLAAFSGDHCHNCPYHPATMSSNLPLHHTSHQNVPNSIANSILLVVKMLRAPGGRNQVCAEQYGSDEDGEILRVVLSCQPL